MKCDICGRTRLRSSPKGCFFTVPADETRRREWSEASGISNWKYNIVCADHFRQCELIHGFKLTRLMPSAVPSINIAQKKTDTSGELRAEAALALLDLSFGSDAPQPQQGASNNNVSCSSAYHVPKPHQQGESNNNMSCSSAYHAPQPQQDANNNNHLASFASELAENYRLQRENAKLKRLKAKLEKWGTHKNINWTWQDVSRVICLHAAGPRAYNHLYASGFPLPHVSTLQRWYRKIKIKEGIINFSIKSMHHASDLSEKDKVCVLAFDEMKVAEAFEYDATLDCVKKPANYVQVVMARGLFKSWKQPVFFDYDRRMDVQILSDIVKALYSAGYTVVAVVSDMGPTNRHLWKTLDVSHEKSWFVSPVNPDEKIFAFADAPHLLKLIRNHFLDSGIIWNNTTLYSRTIVDLIALVSKSDVSIAFKLTDEHLTVKNAGRQKVKLAAQVFSNTTANAIRRCYALGYELLEPTETADFIQLVNDWFDVLNSSINTFGHPGKEPYGTKLDDQLSVFERMNALMSKLIIPGRKSLEYFQKGVLMTNSSLVQLFEYLRNKFDLEFLLTNRLNQDIIEHFFGAIQLILTTKCSVIVVFVISLQPYIYKP